MNTLKISFRNILRNRRRSLTSIFAIVVSSFSILVFGGFVNSLGNGMETGFVQNNGHLHIYPEGYFDYGSGNPSAYGVFNYEELLQKLSTDSYLKDKINVATPFLFVFGIVSSSEKNVSKTFGGRGLVPSQVNKMKKWIGHFVFNKYVTEVGFKDSDLDSAVVGEGMGRILHFCKELKIANCKEDMLAAGEASFNKNESDLKKQIGNIPDEPEETTRAAGRGPRLDILASSNHGAPNVVTVYVDQVINLGIKEIDENYLAMNLSQAQRLLYGAGEKKVTGIILQLTDSIHAPAVEKYLKENLSKLSSQKLEVRNFLELNPVYDQVSKLFNLIFSFISMIMGLIVIFTLVNAMTMNVLERFNEIGSLRALGVRRSHIRALFMCEGFLLGIIGVTVGAILSIAFGQMINSLNLTWIAPGSVRAAPFVIQVLDSPGTVLATGIKIVLIAVISSYFPSNKAAKLEIVDALRHY